jgi:protein O-GlcNAc transferase
MSSKSPRKARRLQSLLDAAGSQLALGDEEAAAATLRRLAREDDCPPFALEQLGFIYIKRGNAKDGAAYLKKSLGPNAGAEQYSNLGYALMLAGDLAESRKFLSRALDLDAGFHPAHNNLALLAQRSGENDRALEHFASAIRLAPNNWNYLSNEATLRHLVGDHHGALRSFLDAIAKGASANPEVLNNLANVLMHLGRYQDALAAYDKAIAIKPDLVDAFYNRANVLKSLQRHDDALSGYERTIALQPDHAQAFVARADTFNSIGRFPEALEAFERYLQLAYGPPDAQRETVIALCKGLYELECLPAIYRDEQHLVDARARLEALVGELAAHVDAVMGKHGGSTPRLAKQSALMVGLFFVAYQLRDDRKVLSAYSESIRKLLGIERENLFAPPQREGKIRFGIASEFLRDHNGSKWAYEWLARLPSEKYEFFCYAFHEIDDEFTRKFSELGTFKRFMFAEENLEKIVSEIKADRLHVLMLPDVGMTNSSRVLSQYRIAPVQFTAWGHPVTTGSPNMDFYLGSALMEPDDGDAHYSETLVRLPNLALFLTPPDFSGIEASRFDLPTDRTIYGSVQSLMKYMPQYDHVFPEIASRDKRALFVFYEGTAGYTTAILQARLDKAFAAAGLDAADYVRFLPRTGRRDFIAFLKVIDVGVDSIGWSGGYTTLQMLELDCPVVTLPTAFMRGRISLGMLRMIGMEELIADSASEFVDKLVRLGVDQAHRADVAARIAASKHRFYEDAEVISALDQFLEREVARRCG